jgi:hypothetical protein
MPSEDDVIDTALDALTPLEMFKAVLGDIANPIGIIKAILWLGKRNDAKAAAYFREAMDEMTVLNAQQVQDVTKRADAHEQRLDEMDLLQERLLEMVLRPEEWKGREHEKPPWSDVVTRAEEFERDVWGAGSHQKRKILVNAFFNSFKPEFYAEGWSKHLWKIAEQIEYPECRWLAERIEKRDHPNILESSRDYFLVQRLKQLGLVATLNVGTTSQSPLPLAKTFVTEVGERFKDFAQDEKRLPVYPLPTSR